MSSPTPSVCRQNASFLPDICSSWQVEVGLYCRFQAILGIFLADRQIRHPPQKRMIFRIFFVAFMFRELLSATCTANMSKNPSWGRTQIAFSR